MRFVDDTFSPALLEAIRGNCWSVWEGCVCKHRKHHDGPHECPDERCNTSWTTEQAEAWMEAERKAQYSDAHVNDRHRIRER